MVLKTALRIWVIGHLCFFILDLIVSGPAVLLDEVFAIISSLFALPLFFLAAFIARRLAFRPAISISVMLLLSTGITYTAFYYASYGVFDYQPAFPAIEPNLLHQFIAAMASTVLANFLSYRSLAEFTDLKREAYNNFQQPSNGAVIQQSSSNLQP